MGHFRVRSSEFRGRKAVRSPKSKTVRHWTLDIGHWTFLFFVSCFLFLSSCALKPKYIVENYSSPEKIAVLPFSNQSIDFDAPVLLRKLFNNELIDRGYNSISSEEIDAKLLEMGISDGGQLASVDPKEIGEKLNVNGLIYGDVIEFKYTTLGFYCARTVEANFKLIGVGVPYDTSLLLWEDERKVSHKDFNFTNVGGALVSQLAEKMVDKALRSPLKKEADEVVNTSVRTLPRRIR